MMSQSELNTPFEALSRSFLLPSQPQVVARVANETIHGHAFDIGTFHLMVDTARHPCEVYEELPLCTLPGSPPHLVGMANQRGNIVPIFDLRRMLDYSPAEGRNFYLILGERDDAIGFRINTLPRRVQLSREEQITTALPIPHLLETHLRHFYQQGEQFIADWNLTTFLEEMAFTARE